MLIASHKFKNQPNKMFVCFVFSKEGKLGTAALAEITSLHLYKRMQKI
jgi:hypothetical protein